jgi:ATP-dependent exoDNAse (exonuclease V) alpha subunit
MAIFHLSAKIISRGKGQSAIAAAAYRSGERLRDEQADEQKFYQTRAERIVFTALMTPKDAPEWARDRNALWNHAERAEKRKDAQLAREFEMSLPHELTEQQREWLVKDFAREAFTRKGYAVDIAIHAPDKESDERNHHAHLMVTMRTLGADGFAAEKDRDLNSRAQLGAWREQWAHLANRHLERHGHEARIDHRSLKEQGIDREAGVHLGYAANEMAQRGAQSDRMDRLKGVIERNDIRLEMTALDREAAELERQKARGAASDGLEWTDRGGLVAQEASAMNAIRDQARQRAAPPASSQPRQSPTGAPADITKTGAAGAEPAKPPPPQADRASGDSGLMADFVKAETKKKAAEEAAARAKEASRDRDGKGGRTR